MNDNHKRHAAATIRYIAEMLEDARRALTGAEQEHAEVVDTDGAPPTRRAALAQIERLQEALEAARASLGLDEAPPRADALRRARAAVTVADIAISDLEPRSMRGYGDLPAREAAELERLCTLLREMFGELRNALEAPVDGGDGGA